jgi:formate dehydrogenase accessory protein FdhE
VDFWQKQILRATELAQTSDGANELLVFYAHLLRAQSQIYEFLVSQRNWQPSGALERDLTVFRSTFPIVLKTVEEAGPAPLVEKARRLKSQSPQAIDEMLLNYWSAPSETEFFAKAFLQPYGCFASATGRQVLNPGSERRCPACGGKPQLSFLQNKETTAESGNRDLMCAKCLSVWPFRRVVCASCGEEEPSKLGYFESTAINHVRIEACDTCMHYLKSVDLTRSGNAQPLVDEVAAAPLDLWATGHGYKKIELNLVGL